MISESEAKRQVARMSQLDGFPREPVAIKELVQAVMACTTDAQAIRTVNAVMESATQGTRCPYPADLRRIAADHAGTPAVLPNHLQGQQHDRGSQQAGIPRPLGVGTDHGFSTEPSH